jgi:hypothetical protein
MAASVSTAIGKMNRPPPTPDQKHSGLSNETTADSGQEGLSQTQLLRSKAMKKKDTASRRRAGKRLPIDSSENYKTLPLPFPIGIAHSAAPVEVRTIA